MNLKATSSKVCVLLALIFLINPVIATADALFSSSPSSTSPISLSTSEPASDMPCHEENSSTIDKQKLVDEKKHAHSDMASDCCEDVCQCDDSGCHTSSIVFQANTQFHFNTHENHYFQLPIYLSLTFTPSSPPPIV